MERQISSVVSTTYFQLRLIGRIKHHLDYRTLEQVIHALVISRLDSANSILSGVTASGINRLQTVQNNAARLLTGTRKREQIKPVLKSLHWLPVAARISYKVLVLVHKCLYDDKSPKYLAELLQRYTPGRCLRSSMDSTKLCVPRTKRAEGSKSFSFLGPHLWNSLPLSIRSQESVNVFRRMLKTHLFRECYE